MSDPLLSIGEVAEATGIRASALRYYEDEGLIQAASRQGGKRHYRSSVLRRLALVALLQEVGFTVREIAAVFGERKRIRHRWRELAERKLEEVDEHIRRAKRTRELLQAVLACSCDDPGSCAVVTGPGRRRLLPIENRPPARRRPPDRA